MKKCVFCRKTKGGKRITLINAKFIHEDCHNFLEYRPEAISNQMMYLYQKRDSIINKIFSDKLNSGTALCPSLFSGTNAIDKSLLF